MFPTTLPYNIKNTNLDINIQNNNLNTMVHLVCYFKFIVIIDILIKVDHLNINNQNKYGWTVFHYVYRTWNIKIISLF